MRSMKHANFVRAAAHAVCAAVLAAGISVASAADISGAGATFPFPIYAKWADAYKKDTGNGLNYQSIGSGAGIKQIRAKTVTFGANDAPLEAKDLDKDGSATTVEWPSGIGAKGNDGVANNVATTAGAIGYVEYAYADQNKLTYTSMINKAGKTVAPTMETFQAAAASADWDTAPGFYLILANQPGDKSWPMTAATFILMYKKPG